MTIHPPRRALWCSKGKGPGGRNLCYCGCGREVPKGRRTCYSDECIRGWKAINDPQTIRRIVFERDKGICAICGADTEALRRTYRAAILVAANVGDPSWPYGDHTIESFNHVGFTNQQKVARPAGFPRLSRTWWEADHIVPVAEGGGGCGPEGYRTLCCLCHKKETATLAARLAAKRKAEKAAS